MSHDELPPSPSVRHDGESPTARAQSHLREVVYAAATILVTAWCYQMHLALGLAATFLAKHILVAIIARALRLPIREIES
jgi:hypothetical protein